MATRPLIGLTSVYPEHRAELNDFAHALHLPVTDSPETYQYMLYLTQTHLELRSMHTQMRPLHIDFNTPQMQHRIQPKALAQEALIQAIGKKNRTILDVTLGFGRDAFLLAASGRRVMGVERCTAIFALVRDGLHRAKQSAWANPIVQRMQIDTDDSKHYLTTPDMPEVDAVYIDPMHPPRKKHSALVKKDMRVLRDLVGDDQDAEQLLTAALAVAQHRVVVKLPMHSTPLGQRAADFALSGKTTRYDVYLSANH